MKNLNKLDKIRKKFSKLKLKFENFSETQIGKNRDRYVQEFMKLSDLASGFGDEGKKLSQEIQDYIKSIKAERIRYYFKSKDEDNEDNSNILRNIYKRKSNRIISPRPKVANKKKISTKRRGNIGKKSR